MITMKEVRAKYPQYEDMSDQDLAKALHQKFYSDMPYSQFSQAIGLSRKQPIPMKPINPTEGMSGMDKFLAGTGKAFVDVGRGAGQLAGDVVETVGAKRPNWAPTKADIDAARLRDAPLMGTGAGLAGNLFGNIAGFAPLALVPGANTITGGATLGALAGAVQPVSSQESRINQTAVGGIAAGALPAVVKGGRVAKAALVDPFTKKGQERIVGNVMRQATRDPQAVIANLKANRGKTPGFNPTAGQAAMDDGLASLERTARAIDPAGFQNITNNQRSSLVSGVRSVAGSPEARQAAIDAREQAVKVLYEQAKKAAVGGDEELTGLLKRPTIKAGLTKAEKIAADEGRRFALTQGKPSAPTGVLNVKGIPYMSQATPDIYSGLGLHDLKMGIDDAITEGSGGFANRVTGSQMKAKTDYLNWLEQNIPEYAKARTTYADMSKPINQMDIGEELYKRFVPALSDSPDNMFKIRPDSYAQALREGDTLAQRVTGMKGMGLQDIMTPQQMGLLSGVADDAALVSRAGMAGRGTGSDTVQKMAMSNLMSEAGIPNWIQSVGRVPGGWIKTLGQMLYSKNDDALKAILADVIKDPDAAAQAMQMARQDPTKFMQIMQTVGQGGAFALPSAINAQ